MDLTAAISALPGVTTKASRFSSEPAFFVNGREFAHFHAGEVLDVRLTRAGIRALDLAHADDARLTLRGSSDWVEFAFARRADLDRALELVALALEFATGKA